MWLLQDKCPITPFLSTTSQRAYMPGNSGQPGGVVPRDGARSATAAGFAQGSRRVNRFGAPPELLWLWFHIRRPIRRSEHEQPGMGAPR
jgi:hypothetical protein